MSRSKFHMLFVATFMLLVSQTPVAPAGELQRIPSYKDSMEKLAAESAKSEQDVFTPQERVVMQQAAERLAKQLPDPGIKVGERAPDFTLNDARDTPVTLSQEYKKGPVVLVFYRGAWCPFCNLHMKTLYQSLPAFKQYGAQMIAVTPQTPDKSAGQIKKEGYPFRIVSDLDSRVMKAYRLYFELEPALVEVYHKHGLDIEAFNGKGRTVLPVPGTFVIDATGIVRAMQADTDYKQRMEPAAIVAALKALSGEASGPDM